jgi:RHS repeat-associated protein
VAKLLSPAIQSRYYIYDEPGHLMGEYQPSGARVKEYVWADDTLIAILSDYDGSAYQLVETDQLGTPRAVIHPSKNTVIWRWTNDTAFGEHAPQEDPDGNGIAYTLNLRFPGQYYDSESGLVYNYRRYYESGTGRYAQSDPIGLAGGTSTYGYVGGNPLNKIDPFGLVEWSVGIVGGGAGVGPLSGGVYRFQARSECIDGKAYIVNGTAKGIGAGFGAPFSYTGSTEQFSDNRTSLDPYVFDGKFIQLSAGASFPIGTNYSSTRLGDARSDFGWSAEMGSELGTSALYGDSKVTSVVGPIECACKP